MLLVFTNLMILLVFFHLLRNCQEMEHFQLDPTPIQTSLEIKESCHDAPIQASRFEVVEASDVLVSQKAAAFTETQIVPEQQLMPSPEPSSPLSIHSNEADDVSRIACNSLC